MAVIRSDPVGRIEGHMGVTVTVPDPGPGGVVDSAEISGTLYRGLENVIYKRPVQDSTNLTQRTCGVCSVAHGVAASFAVENAMGYASDGSTFTDPDGAKPGITKKGNLIRNIVMGLEHVMSAITHFYVLALWDYIKGPPVAPWAPAFDNSYYGPPGVFPSGYDGLTRPLATPDPFTQINNASSLWGLLMLDYTLALHIRRLTHEAAGRLCGGLPHARNFLPGGSTYSPTSSDIAEISRMMLSIRDFIVTRYKPLTQILAVLFIEYDNSNNTGYASVWPGPAGKDIGAGYGNFLSFGAFNENSGEVSDDEFGLDPATERQKKRLLARGYCLGGSPIVDATDSGQIYEFVARSWYDSSCGPLNPSVGKTDPLKPKSGAYSWIKAPRLVGPCLGVVPMEVGPLARMWINGDYNMYTEGPGGPGTVAQNDVHVSFTAPNFFPNPVPGLDIGAYDLCGNASYDIGISVMDRHRARCLEALKIVDRILGTDGHPDGGWLVQLDPSDPRYIGGAPAAMLKSLPADAAGLGLAEAPRGSLGYWLKTDSLKRIVHYQCVAPTTWNGSPRDDRGNPGPIEEAIQGGVCALGPAVRLSGALSQGEIVPVEVLRVIRAFDPCVACAVH